MASRSPALNPASVPFFPSTLGADGAERPSVSAGLGFRMPTGARDFEPSRASSISFSHSDFRSANSSPTGSVPTTDSGDGITRTGSGTSSPHSSIPGPQSDEKEKRSTHPMSQSFQPLREGEVVVARNNGILDGEETPGPRAIHQWVMRAQGPTTSGQDMVDFSTSVSNAFQDQQPVPPSMPVPNRTSTNSTTHSFNLPFKSSSPVSSIGSASINTSSIDYSSISFEAQIKASPTIRDLLERLARCEYSNREIQRELAEVHGKVNLLVERSLGPMNSEPEFRNPFAPPSSVSRSLTPSGGLGPLQMSPPHATPPVKSDDISQLSSRINTLTSSVGQLLALQTQQHMNSVHQALSQPTGHGPSQIGIDVASNQAVPPPNASQPTLHGHGLPNRPDLRSSPRVPNPPMRTWSAGTLELPMRPADGNANLGRPDMLRDKRRSVVGLMRRDSAGIPDSPSDHWSGNNSPREPGPVASKWEHLPLAPELLRSLNKFGVGPPNKIQQRALPFLLRGSDIIAQAPPTQERIAAYVIPAIHVAVTHMNQRPITRGPIVVMISTTVDQATQAQRMIRDLGGAIGVRSALGVGSTGPSSDISQELRLLQQNTPHIICGTPQKLHALFTSPGGLSGSEVRFLVLDEVDQLIARNLHDFVFSIVKLLPPPRSRGTTAGTPGPSPATSSQSQFSPLDSAVSGLGGSSFPQNNGRRFSAVSTTSASSGEPANPTVSSLSQQIERQTALFSNTVPQDVLNLANAIQLREPVRVLVRRDGNVTHADTSQGTKGLRQFYLYLAFTASGARSDPSTMNTGGGHGIIGSGRGATSSAETTQAREWKLDALADLLDDLEVPQIIVHVGGLTALDAVVFKLAGRGLEAVPLHSDMNAGTKLAALNKFRGSTGTMIRQPAAKVLVVYDVQVKAPDVFQVPLVINYDLPQAVEEYAHRVAPAIANNYSKAGVVVNFVTATGGDVEMLRSIECFYK
ncbi:hypothetical protein DFH11DRAFT_1502528 [Phellopilus nigrolimitatus]|nr:hypothetical protein DFH11DRAFT_1502528 [Phellopilus nigrolimitatus]